MGLVVRFFRTKSLDPSTRYAGWSSPGPGSRIRVDVRVVGRLADLADRGLRRLLDAGDRRQRRGVGLRPERGALQLVEELLRGVEGGAVIPERVADVARIRPEADVHARRAGAGPRVEGGQPVDHVERAVRGRVWIGPRVGETVLARGIGAEHPEVLGVEGRRAADVVREDARLGADLRLRRPGDVPEEARDVALVA